MRPHGEPHGSVFDHVDLERLVGLAGQGRDPPLDVAQVRPCANKSGQKVVKTLSKLGPQMFQK